MKNGSYICTCLTLLAGAVILGIPGRGGRALAQPALFGTATNFTMSEYYAPPHDTQMNSLITGREAQPQPGGRYLIKGLRIETFDEAGGKESVVASMTAPNG